MHTTDRAEPRSRSTAATTATRSGCCAEDDPVFLALGLSDAEGRIKPSRQAKYRQVEEFLRLLDASITDALDKGHLRRPTAEDPLRIVDLGCGNAYLTFAAQRYLTDGPRAAGAADRRRRQGAVARAQQRRRRRARAWTRSSWSARIGGVAARPGARGRARPARLRHRDRRGAGPGGRVGRPAGAGRALLPPRHRRPAAQGADPRAVRHAHPARHPARAARRHPHRRAAGLADAAAGLPRRRRAVRREPAHAAQHDAARGAHRRPGQGRRRCARSTTSWSPPGASARGSPSCSASRADARTGVPGLAGALVVPFVLGAARGARRAPGTVGVHLPGPGDRRVQRAGRASDGLFVTTNDSGDSGRVFVVDPATGETVGVTALGRRARPTSRRSRPAGPGAGLGRRHRRQQRRPRLDHGARVPVGRGDRDGRRARRTTLVYPDGAARRRDAAGGPARPAGSSSSPRTSSAARSTPRPRALVRRPAPTGCARSATCSPIATDGSFFPDGRHFVVRDYTSAAVYTFPGLEQVGVVPRCPTQEQGEGIAVDDDDELLRQHRGAGQPTCCGCGCRPTCAGAGAAAAGAAGAAAGLAAPHRLPRGPRAARGSRAPTGRPGRGCSPAGRGRRPGRAAALAAPR